MPPALSYPVRSARFHAFAAIAGALLLLAITYMLAQPRWETNDDVGMSMVAHGYGLAAFASPKLIYSNILWGYAVQWLPEVPGLFGYSLANILTLGVICTSLLYFLSRLGAGYVPTLLVVALVMGRPIFAPQFTLNAGYLIVAAIMGAHVYMRKGERGALALSCVLVFMSYLIRDRECMLVLLIGAPLLPWRGVFSRNHFAILCLLTLTAAIAIATCIDQRAYSGPEWSAFQALNPARAPYTDFGAADLIAKRPDILARHGYSANDVTLIGDWFFTDPKLADPAALKAMLTELGPLPLQQTSFGLGIAGLRALSEITLLPLLLAAAAMGVAALKKWLLIGWIVFFAAIFAMGAMGRPGVSRVYVPLIGLLLVSGYMQCAARWRALGLGAILVALLVNIALMAQEDVTNARMIAAVQHDMQGVPPGVVISWGAAWPYEFAYPLFAPHFDVHAVKLYPLGTFTLAPFTVSYAEEAKGKGMIAALASPQGIALNANPGEVKLLGIYCREHLNGQLMQEPVYTSASVTVAKTRCVRP